jgi:SAM-dependent methyltransferase
VASTRAFADLVSEAEHASIDGWDFSWLDGRATEARPRWGYTGLVVSRLDRTSSLLDVQTGGGEVLAEILRRAERVPNVIAATEGWAPNAVIARDRLATFGGRVAEVAHDSALPFEPGAFELVIARHPVVIRWDEVARVLAPRGIYLAQHVGPGSNRALSDFLMGPQPVSDVRSAARAVTEATAVGLELVELQTASLRLEFYDIGAVVYFLRKVPWTVPSFTVVEYEDGLRALHDHIESDGRFVSYAQRFLIELAKW